MESNRPRDDAGEERSEHDAVADTERRPLGALAVTGFLSVTILVLWFGMYFLNQARS